MPRALASVLPLSFRIPALELNFPSGTRTRGCFTFFNCHLGMLLKGWYSTGRDYRIHMLVEFSGPG